MCHVSDVQYFPMCHVSDLSCFRCVIVMFLCVFFQMCHVSDVSCFRCVMFQMCHVSDVSCIMFPMCHVSDVSCLRCVICDLQWLDKAKLMMLQVVLMAVKQSTSHTCSQTVIQAVTMSSEKRITVSNITRSSGSTTSSKCIKSAQDCF